MNQVRETPKDRAMRGVVNAGMVFVFGIVILVIMVGWRWASE